MKIHILLRILWVGLVIGILLGFYFLRKTYLNG